MRSLILFLMFIGFIVSCSNDNDTNERFEIRERLEINGLFTHQISDFDSLVNPEFNYIQFVKFNDDSTVDVLMNGGDIVFSTKYQIKDNKIIFEQTGGLNFDISFNIQNETTLKRIEKDEVWKKE